MDILQQLPVHKSIHNQICRPMQPPFLLVHKWYCTNLCVAPIQLYNRVIPTNSAPVPPLAPMNSLIPKKREFIARPNQQSLSRQDTYLLHSILCKGACHNNINEVNRKYGCCSAANPIYMMSTTTF